MEVILTNSQKEAAEKIDKFLKSDQMYFRLTGPPGSGKTFLIKYALERFLKEEEDNTNFITIVFGFILLNKIFYFLPWYLAINSPLLLICNLR